MARSACPAHVLLGLWKFDSPLASQPVRFYSRRLWSSKSLVVLFPSLPLLGLAAGIHHLSNIRPPTPLIARLGCQRPWLPLRKQAFAIQPFALEALQQLPLLFLVLAHYQQLLGLACLHPLDTEDGGDGRLSRG